VLRAVRPVAKEGQLTRSYLGPLSWAPLEVRQAALKDTWGFTCTCARCKEEVRAGAAGLGCCTGAPAVSLNAKAGGGVLVRAQDLGTAARVQVVGSST
jgi:hypothetical protein